MCSAILRRLASFVAPAASGEVTTELPELPEIPAPNSKFRNPVLDDYKGTRGSQKKSFAEANAIFEKYPIQARGPGPTHNAEQYGRQVGRTFHTFQHDFRETSKLIVLYIQNKSKGQHIRMDPDNMPPMPADHRLFNIGEMIGGVDALRQSKREYEAAKPAEKTRPGQIGRAARAFFDPY